MDLRKVDMEEVVCRICRSPEGGQLPIFGTSGAERTIPNKIHDCLPIKVREKDGLPQTVCQGCVVQLESFSRFRDMARTSHSHLAGSSSSDSDNSHSKLHSYKDKDGEEENDKNKIMYGQLAEPRPEDYVLMKEETINVDNSGKTSNVMADYLVEFNNNTKIKTESGLIDKDIVSAMRRRHEVMPPMWDVFERVQSEQERALQSVDGKLKGSKQALRTVLKGKFSVIHRRYVVSKGAFPCSLCGRCFRFNQGHSRDGAEAESDSEMTEGMHGCTTCNRLFHSQEELNIHMQMHQNEGVSDPALTPSSPCSPSSCTICGLGFTRKEHMIRHMATHGPSPRPFQCDICNKVFTRKEHLQRHKLIHSADSAEPVEEKPFVCTPCGLAFVRKEQLAKHKKLVHNMDEGDGEPKPYDCNHCSKKFTRREHLFRHRKIHMKELRDIPATVNAQIKQQSNDTITLEISAAGGNGGSLTQINPDIINILDRGRYGNTSIEPAPAAPVVATPTPPPYYPAGGLTEEQRAQLEGFLDSSMTVEPELMSFESREHGATPTDELGMEEKETISLDDLKRMPKCRICAKAFTKKNHLNRHLKRYHNLNKEQVNSGKYEMYENGEARGLDTGDDLEMDEVGDEEGGPIVKRPKCIFTCSVCRKTFTRKYHMYRHQKTQHGIEFPSRDQQKDEVKCSDCGMIFMCADELNSHDCADYMDDREPARRKAASVGGFFKCAICKLSFETHDGFKEHECKKAAARALAGTPPVPSLLSVPSPLPLAVSLAPN